MRQRIPALLMAAALLCACAPAAETPAQTPAPPAVSTPAPIPVSSPSPTPTPAPTPEPTPRLISENEYGVVEYTTASEGFISVTYTAETSSRLKARVVGPAATYTYNIHPGEPAVFPLSEGSGDYTVTLYENVYDSKYAAVLSCSFTALLRDEFAPFLHPNQYVNYAEAPDTVAMAEELTAGLADTLEKVEAVYDFTIAHLSYDTALAATVQSGYLPVLDEVLASGKGICFDYAALMTGMLRSRDVPCKLVVGYAGNQYHAWISVWTAEEGWLDGLIFFDGSSWQRMDPTFASGTGESMLDFIGEDSNYVEKYVY